MPLSDTDLASILNPKPTQEFDQVVWANPTPWAWLLRLQFRMRALTQHFLFTYLTLFCIWGTFMVLAIEYDGISDDLQTALISTNYAFVATFVFEVSAGMTAFGPVAYLSDAWNIFDFILTAVALGELGAESQGGLDIVRQVLRCLWTGTCLDGQHGDCH